jgi:xanthine dehydrogenase accessory factor
MYDEFYSKLEALRKQHELFVTATVVQREVPSSGKSGDKAIIDQKGDITGWIGGGCVKGIVLKEAERAMQTGKPRLVKVGRPVAGEPQDSVIEYKMTCMSEGIVEIFVEPILPPPHMVVMGKTSIAKALVRLARATGYRVTAVAPDVKPNTFDKPDELITQMSLKGVKISPASAIVVCTQGENDEEALEQILDQPAFYKGFVASPRKKEKVFENLVELGFDPNKIGEIHAPAGVNINAKKPDEVAISILAQLIQIRNSSEVTGFKAFKNTGPAADTPKFYVNPVCGVLVDINNPKHIIEYKGEKVYFCCDGCKVKFEGDPEKYLNATTYEGH